MRLLHNQPAFPRNPSAPWNEQTAWPAWWVDCAAAGEPPFVTLYRLGVNFDAPARLRFHVSADERYILFLDDNELGRGPERGSPLHWFYESFQLDLPPGAHIFWALVWSAGPYAAPAQMSLRPGFLFAAEGQHEALSTGLANWQTCPLPGWDYLEARQAFWRGRRFRVSRPLPTLAALHALDWQPARRVSRAFERIEDWEVYQKRRLQPAAIPPLLRKTHLPGKVRLVSAPSTGDPEAVQAIPLAPVPPPQPGEDWQAFANGQGQIQLPPGVIRRVVFDFDDYLVAYPQLTLSGGRGARIRVGWAESARAQPDFWNNDKGHRDELWGKYLVTQADEILPDGSNHARYAPLWWQAGRYLELLIVTGAEPLTLHKLTLEETRYPLEMESAFDCSDPRLTGALPMLVRGLQANANETFFDCPHYEELQYIGDTRLQALCHAVMTRDDRLTRKALRLFDTSRQPEGFLQARYPCSITQVIAPFSLYWVGMLWDYACWRDDPGLVRALLPGMRATLEAFRRHVGDDNLLYAPEAWNFMDWIDAWNEAAGVPLDGLEGASAPLHWQLVYALSLAADLESWLGEPELAAYYARWGAALAQAGQVFWDEERGLFANDLAHTQFSDHPQAFAVLSGQLAPEQQTRLAQTWPQADMHCATYFFLHYCLEAYRLLGLEETIYAQLRRWDSEMVQRGLKTPLERVEPSRSDCHAWSSHPLYHYFATVLGIRPTAPGFASVEIAPLLGDLEYATGTLLHPAGGEIRVEFRQKDGRVSGRVELPPGLRGTLRLNGTVRHIEGIITF
jgi:hypothetical protein